MRRLYTKEKEQILQKYYGEKMRLRKFKMLQTVTICL